MVIQHALQFHMQLRLLKRFSTMVHGWVIASIKSIGCV